MEELQAYPNSSSTTSDVATDTDKDNLYSPISADFFSDYTTTHYSVVNYYSTTTNISNKNLFENKHWNIFIDQYSL